MSTRPTSAVVRAVTDGSALVPLSNRLHAVLAVGMRSSPVVSTGVVYSDEPSVTDPVLYFGDEDEYREPYAIDDPRWSNDYEWVVDRVREYSQYFMLASREFRKDRALAMIAIAGAGALLGELSPKFRNDREIVKTALPDFPEVYEYVSGELKRDDEIIRLAFSGRGGAFIFHYLPEDLKENRDYMRLAVKGYFKMFNALPESARRDRQFVLELLELTPQIAEYLSELYTDQEFWVAAVKASEHNIVDIPKTIPKTREFLLKIVQSNGKVLSFLMRHQKEWFEMFKRVNSLTDWKMDIEELENEPDFRMAAATAERNPNMEMMGALLHDLGAAIEVLVKETLIVGETDMMRVARMERLEGYQTVLQKLAASQHVVPGGPIEAKLEELTALLNHPKKSEDLFKYRQRRDMRDMLEDEETKPGAKRARVATEARALDAGFGMARISVHTPHKF